MKWEQQPLGERMNPASDCTLGKGKTPSKSIQQGPRSTLLKECSICVVALENTRWMG
ncbi:hypothetical protein LEMLEM_LOCUS18633 [Lemmus lemmus]